MTAWLALIDPISKLFDRLIPDPQARAAAELELRKENNSVYLQELQVALQADQAQAAINLEEAKNESVFVAGWRPFCGWVCGVALAYHFVLQPLLAFGLANSGHPVELPEFDMDTLMTVLLGLLRLGGLRSLEKVKGVVK